MNILLKSIAIFLGSIWLGFISNFVTSSPSQAQTCDQLFNKSSSNKSSSNKSSSTILFFQRKLATARTTRQVRTGGQPAQVEALRAAQEPVKRLAAVETLIPFLTRLTDAEISSFLEAAKLSHVVKAERIDFSENRYVVTIDGEQTIVSRRGLSFLIGMVRETSNLTTHFTAADAGKFFLKVLKYKTSVGHHGRQLVEPVTFSLINGLFRDHFFGRDAQRDQRLSEDDRKLWREAVDRVEWRKLASELQADAGFIFFGDKRLELEFTDTVDQLEVYLRDPDAAWYFSRLSQKEQRMDLTKIYFILRAIQRQPRKNPYSLGGTPPSDMHLQLRPLALLADQAKLFDFFAIQYFSDNLTPRMLEEFQDYAKWGDTRDIDLVLLQRIRRSEANDPMIAKEVFNQLTRFLFFRTD